LDTIWVLDHGYVKKIEHWGSDERVIEAARMSTNKGFQGWGPVCSWCKLPLDNDSVQQVCVCDMLCEPKPGDEKLLRYLYENQHATPFEMAGLVIEVQAPIFVFREWHRHRTQSYNEMSARYTPLPDLNYIPSVERLMANASGTNKQANRAEGAEVLTDDVARAVRRNMAGMYALQENDYQNMLRVGVPKELARLVLPVGRYSRMRASANLRNWLAFLTLRLAPNAQWEIRQFAEAVAKLVAETFPRTWALFEEGRGA
jgi:thymidylate synthase (FAD)